MPAHSLLKHIIGTSIFITVFGCFLDATPLVSAQGDSGMHVRTQRPWDAFDTYRAWVGYNRDFYVKGTAGGSVFADVEGGTGFCRSCFWEEAEEIEMAEDAYNWAKIHDAVHLPAYRAEIEELCKGFVANMAPGFKGPGGQYDWSGDKFNDDLNWSVMAFARAYRITRDPNWLFAAKMNFNTVWNRAQDPGGLGDGMSGLIQSQPHGNNWKPNLDSPVNFTFVIGGYMLYDITRDPEFKTEADNVYQWSMTHLYTTSINEGVCNGAPGLTCAKIYDAVNGHSDYTYNYGIAIEASVREHNRRAVDYIANWLMHNSNNPNYPYVGTYEGFNILPNYRQGGKNDSGYNGIALRGVGYALRYGDLNRRQLAWARANVAVAWNIRNRDALMWNNWTPDDPAAITPEAGLYSWDCSPALAGMFDIPAPRGLGNGVGEP